jgi:hypothetical protein
LESFTNFPRHLYKFIYFIILSYTKFRALHLDTDLDSATLDLSRIHEEVEDAHVRIASLEAQLEGRNPPELKSLP